MSVYYLEQINHLFVAKKMCFFFHHVCLRSASHGNPKLKKPGKKLRKRRRANVRQRKSKKLLSVILPHLATLKFERQLPLTKFQIRSKLLAQVLLTFQNLQKKPVQNQKLKLKMKRSLTKLQLHRPTARLNPKLTQRWHSWPANISSPARVAV